ncbi:hypothetical protein PYW08_015132 [Mythimna loreyi]|uniref:Uncharacterized protein n=1 Tax=Mythimna loreyi TaxID=667449 RepID=A0ACC2QWQ4_9NEOP|nr:hypothetical protein PYW08_015132 [Mythimna loreyi]
MMEFVSMKVAMLDWYDREERTAYFLREDDIDQCATERLLRNQFYDPLVSSDSDDDTPNNINWDQIFKNNKLQQKHKTFVPCMRPVALYPRLSEMTSQQHIQFLKILSLENPTVLEDLVLGKPTRKDFKDFEAAKETYLKEQEAYKEWAKSLWATDHCIRALRPKPAVERVYEAEFKMKAQRMQALPKQYDLAAQISLDSGKSNCSAVLKEELIKVSLAEMPQVHIPDKIEKQFNIITPCTVPEPCQKHPYQIVLPNEESLSILPITEIHRELATFALNNDSQYIASENALKCLTQWNRHWLLPLSVCDTIGADGKRVNVIVLDSEFSVHKEAAHMRAYKAYRHLLENALIPSSEKEKISAISRSRVLKKGVLASSKLKVPAKPVVQDIDMSSDDEDNKLFIDTGEDEDMAEPEFAGFSPPKVQLVSLLHTPYAAMISPNASLCSPKEGFAPPSTSLHSPNAELPSTSACLRSPKAGLPSPTASCISPKAAFSPLREGLRSPKAGFAPPAANLRSPKAGFASPVASLTSPKAGFASPIASITSPKAGFASPNAGLVSPKAGFSSPAANLRSPKAGFASPAANLRSPRAGFASPTESLTSPKAGFASPTASLTSPKAGFASPTASLTSPKAGFASPTASLTSPKAGFASPGSSFGSPKALSFGSPAAKKCMKAKTEAIPRRSARLGGQETTANLTATNSNASEDCPMIVVESLTTTASRRPSKECPIPNGALPKRIAHKKVNEECPAVPDIGVYSCTCKGTYYEKPPRRSFRKWQFNKEDTNEKLDIIIHSPHKAKDKTEELILEPLPEYQIDLGASEPFPDALRSAALSLALRKKASLLNVRLDGPTGEVVTFEKVSSEVFTEKHPDVTRQVISAIHTALSQLQELRPGHYVLQHEPSHGANAMLMCPRSAQQRHSLLLNFDSDQLIEVDEAQMAKMPPTISTTLLPYHKHRRVLPCAFTPYENHVAKETKKPASKKKAPPQAIKFPKRRRKKNNKW